MQTTGTLNSMQIRVLLGAYGPQTMQHRPWPNPDGVTDDGWVHYPGIMRCLECPMAIREKNGLYACVCSLSSRGVIPGAPCAYGIRDDGRGLTQTDYTQRDASLKARPSYVTKPQAGIPSVTVTRSRNQHPQARLLEITRDFIPDVDPYSFPNAQKIADAVHMTVDDLNREIERLFGTEE